MSKLQFDDDNRVVRGGVDHVVLYPKSKNYAGFPWDGVTEVNVNPNGGDVNSIWADNICYAKVRGNESFAGSIKAYDYPAEWKPCIGVILAEQTNIVSAGGQSHDPFNMCYRTKTYDKTGVWVWSTYHVLFGLTAGTSEETAKTLEEGFDPAEFTFDFEGTPVKFKSTDVVSCEYTFDVPVSGGKEVATVPSAALTVNGREFTVADITKALAVLVKLYGGEGDTANAACADTTSTF